MGNKKSHPRWVTMKEFLRENRQTIILSVVTTIVCRILLG